MIEAIGWIIVGILLGIAASLLYCNRTRLGTSATKGSATARLAEHDTKLAVLKTATAAKKDLALDVHKALDEVDKLVG
jgi:hypothetical protein